MRAPSGAEGRAGQIRVRDVQPVRVRPRVTTPQLHEDLAERVHRLLRRRSPSAAGKSAPTLDDHSHRQRCRGQCRPGNPACRAAVQRTALGRPVRHAPAGRTRHRRLPRAVGRAVRRRSAGDRSVARPLAGRRRARGPARPRRRGDRAARRLAERHRERLRDRPRARVRRTVLRPARHRVPTGHQGESDAGGRGLGTRRRPQSGRTGLRPLLPRPGRTGVHTGLDR